MFKKFKSKIKNHNSGMTLVELMVVLAIFFIISGITMVDYSSFKSSASLNNLANDIALSIRKAQSYAIGAKGNQGHFDYGYGIHFSEDSNSFIIFVDKNGNRVYDGGESLEELSINSADRIYQFRKKCQPNASSFQPDLDISFRRPNLGASFANPYSGFEVAIDLKDSKGKISKFVCVSVTGQIRVGNY